jgi:hypothetical protein
MPVKMKIALISFIFVSLVNKSIAQLEPRAISGKTGRTEKGYWFTGIASGYYFPIQRFSSPYTFNGGGSYFGGYQLDSRLAFQLEWNNWLLSGGGLDTWDLKIASELKWNFTPSQKKCRPFVLSGIGFNYQLHQPKAVSYRNITFPFGIGLQWYLHPKSCVIIEGLYYLIIGKTTTQAIPALLGYSVGF